MSFEAWCLLIALVAALIGTGVGLIANYNETRIEIARIQAGCK
jgi:hypothetical protein